MENIDIPTKQDIEETYERIKEYKHITPLLTGQSINEEAGCKIYFKCENFQKTNSFKVRGSANAFLQLKAEVEEKGEKLKGVCTNSSGNHAGALAYISNLFNIPNKIVMPSNSAQIKVDNVKNYKGDIVYCQPTEDKRAEMTQQMHLEYDYNIIHPYDNINIIIGQATCA